MPAPVTIKLPDLPRAASHVDAGDRRGPIYAAGLLRRAACHTFTQEEIGTRYVLVGIRTLVDPADPKDVEAVHALQDAMRVEQPGGPGKFEVPHWDPASQKKVREALLALAATLPDTKRHVRPEGQRSIRCGA